jgi:two-component sensor histidine kinase
VIRVTDVNLPLDVAIPCGLILNELASNVMKYAFPERDGILTLAMRRKPDQTYEFVVSDNGVGLPPDCDPYHPQSLGLQLVKGLVEEQLEGTLELNTRRGVTWKIRFR